MGAPLRCGQPHTSTLYEQKWSYLYCRCYETRPASWGPHLRPRTPRWRMTRAGSPSFPPSESRPALDPATTSWHNCLSNRVGNNNYLFISWINIWILGTNLKVPDEQQQAWFRKKCCHSYDTDLVWESLEKSFNSLALIGSDNNFFRWEMDFYRFCKNNILQTKAVLIVLLDLPIIIQTHAEFCITQQI